MGSVVFNATVAADRAELELAAASARDEVDRLTVARLEQEATMARSAASAAWRSQYEGTLGEPFPQQFCQMLESPASAPLMPSSQASPGASADTTVRNVSVSWYRAWASFVMYARRRCRSSISCSQ